MRRPIVLALAALIASAVFLIAGGIVYNIPAVNERLYPRVDRFMNGLRERFKVIVGGAPTSKRWADEIGADGQGPNAMESVELAKRLVGTAEVHSAAEVG